MKTYRVDDTTMIQADNVISEDGVLTFLVRDGHKVLPSETCIAVLNRNEWSRVMSDDAQAFADAVEKLKHLGSTIDHVAGVAVARIATLQGDVGRAASPAAMHRMIVQSLTAWLGIPISRSTGRDDETLIDAHIAINGLDQAVKDAIGITPGMALTDSAWLMAEYLRRPTAEQPLTSEQAKAMFTAVDEADANRASRQE